MDEIEILAQSLVKCNLEKVIELTKNMLSKGVEPSVIISEGLMPGMEVVGRKMKNEEMYIPEVLLSAKAMESAMDILEPFLTEGDLPTHGTIILGTVKGDIHSIGKNLVGIMLKRTGFKIIDLGENVSPEAFVDAVKKTKADIVGMSALLTTTMFAMKDTIDLLEKEDLRANIKIIVGGAPVNQNFADSITADGYAADAGEAVDLCKTLLEK